MVVNTPPLGISLFKTWGENISQKVVCDAADAAEKLGLGKAGYEYIIIGDAWCKKTRDKNGELVEDREKFPDGLKFVSDHLHSKGFKLGIVTSVGAATPNGYPGSYDREFVDAKTFGRLGVDYISHVFCHVPAKGGFFMPLRSMSMALKHSGRDIFYAVNFDYDGAQKYIYYAGYTWEGIDLKEFEQDHYPIEKWIRSTGVHSYCTKALEKPFDPQLGDNIQGYTGTGCWHSLGDIVHCCCCDDALNALKTKMITCAMKISPIIIDTDVTKLCDKAVEVMTNSAVISMLKDEESRSSAKQGDGNTFVLTRLLCDRKYAIAFVNDSDEAASVPFYGYDFGLTYNCGLTCKACEVMGDEKLEFADYVSVDVPARSARLFEMVME